MKKYILEWTRTPHMKPERLVFKGKKGGERQFQTSIECILFSDETLKEFASPEPNGAFMELLKKLFYIYWQRCLKPIQSDFKVYEDSHLTSISTRANIIQKYCTAFLGNETNSFKVLEVEIKKREREYPIKREKSRSIFAKDGLD